MEFAFTDEQELIRTTARDFLTAQSTPRDVRTAMETERGYDDELWKRLCDEMGWPAVHIPEAYGGLGLGFVELATVLELCGEALVCSPLFSTACLAVPTLLALGTEEQCKEHLGAIAAGACTATLAWSEANGRTDLDAVTASFQRQGEGYVLDGVKRYVVDGASSDLLLVAARKPGTSGRDGIGVFAIPASSPGVACALLPTLDSTRKLAEIRLEGVEVPLSAAVGEPGAAGPGLLQALQVATLCLAAEQVGGAARCLEMSVAYTRDRVQFGRPIASFQAVKHKCADMMVAVESARSAAYYAACVAQEVMFGAGTDRELAEAASVAGASASDAFTHCAGEALQLHGGVGFTWECDIHLYLKRARAASAMFGPPSQHRERIAQMIL